MNAATPRPVASITRLDDLELISLEPEHAPIVIQMVAQRGNRFLLDVPADPVQVAAVLAELQGAPWALPMAIVRHDDCVGLATTGLANLRGLHTSVMSLFVDPGHATTALALYIRHVLWNYPVTRLHTQVPLMDLTREYVDLYVSTGFVDEGRLREHALVAGHAFDVATLGLTRAEFEQWCAQHEPRLAL